MRQLRVLCTLGLVAASAVGCSRDRVPTLAPESASALLESDAGSNGPSLKQVPRPIVSVTTNDSLQYVEARHRDPWMRHSTVTAAASFVLSVRNEGNRPAHKVRLIVSVPNNLPEFGWSVTVDNQLFAGTSMFPLSRLRLTGYPFHHLLYPPTGDACFVVLSGPSVLAPGAVWDVPVDLFRGATDGFKVHFDVAVNPTLASPRRGVTAAPPMSDPESADGRSPFDGRGR